MIDKLALADPLTINQEAHARLLHLLDRCTINLIAGICGISRPTLYRWLDEDVAFEDMNHQVAFWFLAQCEYHPKLKQLAARAPMTYPRLAGRTLTEGDDNDAPSSQKH